MSANMQLKRTAFVFCVRCLFSHSLRASYLCKHLISFFVITQGNISSVKINGPSSQSSFEKMIKAVGDKHKKMRSSPKQNSKKGKHLHYTVNDWARYLTREAAAPVHDHL